MKFVAGQEVVISNSSFLNGVRARVKECVDDKEAMYYEVELLETRRAYNVGDVVMVEQYEMEAV